MNLNKNQSRPWYHAAKEADIFGESIIFTIGKKTTLKTMVGFFFTLVMVGIGIFMFFFMGQSFFFKINPTTTFSQTRATNPLMRNTTNNNKLFVAFRLMDSEFNVLSPDGSYYTAKASYYQPNQPTSSQSMGMIPCKDSLALDINYIEDRGLSDYVCLPINNDYLGGSITDANYTYFNLQISFCNSNINSNCDTLFRENQVDTGTSTGFVTIDLAYPEIFFDPNNIDNALTIEHTTTTDKYTSYTYLDRSLFFKQTTLLDDQGWIFQENVNSTLIGFAETTSANYYKPNYNSNFLITNYDFYMGNIQETYTRKFQKIQDVIAVVGGFLRICQIALKIILTNYVKHLRNIEIMNGIINWKDDEEEVKIPSGYYDKASMDSKLKRMFRMVSNELNSLTKGDNTDAQTLNPNTNSIHGKHDDSHIIEISDQTMLRLKEKKNELNLNPKQIDKKSFDISKKEIELEHIKKIPISDIKNTIITSQKKKKYFFSLQLRELIKKSFCRRLLSKKQLKKVKLYELAEDFLKDRLDVIGYLNFINEVNKMKSILFNQEQSSSLNYIENPTIYVNNPKLQIENIPNLKFLLPNKNQNLSEIEVRNISDYFSQKMYEKKLNETDKYILMSLDETILKEITLKSINMIEKLKNNQLMRFDSNEKGKHLNDGILDF